LPWFGSLLLNSFQRDDFVFTFDEDGAQVTGLVASATLQALGLIDHVGLFPLSCDGV
jgi:hypothetical protein